MYKENNLSKNQQIIFDLINKSSEPLKAYTILFSVQKKGIKAPPQVYRCLLYTSPSPRDRQKSRMPSSA